MRFLQHLHGLCIVQHAALSTALVGADKWKARQAVGVVVNSIDWSSLQSKCSRGPAAVLRVSLYLSVILCDMYACLFV